MLFSIPRLYFKSHENDTKNHTIIEHINITDPALFINDIILSKTSFETLNLLYGGSINTFAPVSFMDRSGITLIRPLIYAPEKSIKTFIKKNNIEVMPKCCPMDGVSKREDMKNLIGNLQKDIPTVKTNIYGAIKRSNIPGWNKNKTSR